MAVAGKQFLGRLYYRPGARGAFRASRQPQSPSPDLFTQIIIGRADNGPNCNDTALKDSERFTMVSSFEEAKAILRSGELLEAVKLASSPSSDDRFIAGPQYYKLYNINPNTKATVPLPSIDVGVNHTLNAVVAGPAGNTIREKYTAATKTLEFGDSEGISTSVPLTKSAFSIQYTGNGTAAALLIDATGITVTLTGASDGSANLAATFANYKNLGDLINYINTRQGYVAILLDSPDFLTKDLDHVTALDAVDIKTAAYTVLADLFMFETFVNASGLAVIVSNAIRRPVANQAIFLFLAGAITGTPGGTAMQDAITFSEKETGLYRNILTAVLADQIFFATSIEKLNSPDGSNEAIGGTGGDTSMSLATKISNAKSLNDKYIVYGISKFNAFDLTNTKKQYPGYMLAVIRNAIHASLDPRHAATWKPLNIIDTDEVFTKAERDTIIQAGGMAVFKRPIDNAWAIERDITTYQAANIVYNEATSVNVALAMVKDLREGFQQNFIGESPVDDSAFVPGPRVEDLKTFLDLKLEEYVSKGWLVGSVLLEKAAFRTDYQIVVDGDAFYFTGIKGNVVTPINFIFFLLELDVLRGSI